MNPSLYLHIPFCKSKCAYCSFYSVPYRETVAHSYIDILLKQIESSPVSNTPLTCASHTLSPSGRGEGEGISVPIHRPINPVKYSSIYIGGGTPTIINKNQLEKLIRGLKKSLSDDGEFTIEANPDSLDNEKLSILINGGVNRISIGVQSFNDDILKKLGRAHNAKEAEDAILRAQEKGFKNISIDLIFGIWGQTMEEWQKDLEHAIKLPVTHISCYALTYEKGTPINTMVENSTIVPLSDDVEAKMYEHAISYLPEHGFAQYEVSNFSSNGFSCKHNMHYWENNPYFGLGASSVSYIDGVRDANISDVEEFIQRAENKETLSLYKEQLTPEKNAKETAALKIRTSDGIDFAWFKKKTGFDFPELEKEDIPGLIENGLLVYTNKNGNGGNTGICLTKKGFLFCDSVSSAFL